MAVVIWGLLEKSLIDDETIEEAIDRIVAVHEADPDSHLAVGESLQSHKASAIIDHAALSIITDKLAELAVTGPKITNDQIVGKDIRTAADVGAGVDGVKITSTGIEMWQSADKKVDIPVSGSPTFKGDVSVRSLSYLRYTWILPFEVITNYDTTIPANTALTPNIESLRFTHAGAANSILNISLGENYTIPYNSEKNPSIEFAARVGDPDSGIEWRIAWGTNDPFNAAIYPWFGFKFTEAGDVIAFVMTSGAGGTGSTLSVADYSVVHRYKAQVRNNGDYVDFYVDGVLETSLSMIGAHINNDYWWVIAGKMLGAVETNLDVFNLVLQQDF